MRDEYYIFSTKTDEEISDIPACHIVAYNSYFISLSFDNDRSLSIIYPYDCMLLWFGIAFEFLNALLSPFRNFAPLFDKRPRARAPLSSMLNTSLGVNCRQSKMRQGQAV